jgi:hypothetical protein
MIKATVWTSWNFSETDYKKAKPKCIFNEEVLTVPREGEYIVVRAGFCSEMVKTITHDFVKNEIKITIKDSDKNNEYGPCLYHILEE